MVQMTIPENQRLKAECRLKHLTQDSNRPGVLVLGNKGIPQFDPLAKKPKAFFNMSRSMRNRLFSSCNRCNSS